VNVPIVGHQLEQLVVNSVKESWSQAARLATEVLNERAAARSGA
jgi:hypothetical protein